MYEVADVGAGLEKDIRREKVRTTLFRRLPHALSCLFEGEQGSPASPQQTSKRKKKKKKKKKKRVYVPGELVARGERWVEGRAMVARQVPSLSLEDGSVPC